MVTKQHFENILLIETLYNIRHCKTSVCLSVKQVAFSASLLASGSETLGPFNTYTPLVFRYVVTNIGNAYNPNTGSQILSFKLIWLLLCWLQPVKQMLQQTFIIYRHWQKVSHRFFHCTRERSLPLWVLHRCTWTCFPCCRCCVGQEWTKYFYCIWVSAIPLWKFC